MRINHRVTEFIGNFNEEEAGAFMQTGQHLWRESRHDPLFCRQAHQSFGESAA